MKIEQEIKLVVNSHQPILLSQLDLAPYQQSAVTSQDLKNQYFDTPSHSLTQQKMALRLRANKGHYLQTVKTMGTTHHQVHRRQEWEQVVPSMQLDKAHLLTTPLAALVSDPEVWSALDVLFTTDFTRQVIQLNDGENHIELAYDRGQVSAMKKTCPIHELELELVAGTVDTLPILAQRLMQSGQFTISEGSKAAMGYRLVSETSVPRTQTARS